MTETTKHTPLVSVIMPVYNAEKFLRESIDSILRQTFQDFEFIIINDGSTDSSQNIIDEYTLRDVRIIAIKQENHGVVYTANKGISLARGEYIARMDADDVSFPDRLRQQVNILNQHPTTVLVCSNFEIFDDNGEYRYRELVPPENNEIQRALYLRNPIANGSTLIRKKSLVEAGLFDEIFAEDFHMWIKLSKLGHFESTGSMLYRWRMNPSGLTLTNNELSMDQGKQYIADRWADTPPKPLSRREILAIISHYKHLNISHAKSYLDLTLADISQLAAKLFTSGRRREGIQQLFALASSGGLGFRTAVQRIYLIAFGHYGKLRRRILSSSKIYEKDAT